MTGLGGACRAGSQRHLPTRPPTHPPPWCLQDFRARIRKYEDGYETIMDRTLHYIKLIDMVTGGWGACCHAWHHLHACVCEGSVTDHPQTLMRLVRHPALTRSRLPGPQGEATWM